ncbi:MAG: P-II family nitrogen regulator [Bacteroidota bacterium]
MTVNEGDGTGRYINAEKLHGSLTFPGMHAHIIKIEIAIDDDAASKFVRIIQEHAHTGHTRDGIIFVTTIDDTVRIVDGESGYEALL